MKRKVCPLPAPNWSRPLPRSVEGWPSSEDRSLAFRGSVGAVLSFSVNDSTGDLTYYQLVLPPNAAVAFEVTFQVAPQIDNGSVQIDFSSGSFEVRCPLVEIGILS
jgi:hypothetical protein